MATADGKRQQEAYKITGKELADLFISFQDNQKPLAIFSARFWLYGENPTHLPPPQKSLPGLLTGNITTRINTLLCIFNNGVDRAMVKISEGDINAQA